MTEQEKAEFGRILNALAATFNRELDAAALEGYWIGCKELSLAEFNNAVHRAFQTCDMMPTVKALLGTQAAKEAQDSSEAFEELKKAIRTFGSYRSPTFRDPAISNAVRDMGGWQHICKMPQDEFMKWGRKEFLEAYENANKLGLEAKQLRGIHEENRLLGQ